MALPKAAQRQVDEANRILESMQANRQQEEPELSVVEEPVEEAVEEPTEDLVKEPTEDLVKEPTEEPVEELPAAEPVVAEDFEQKYKVLQGKYDAEVPRLHRQIQDLSDQLQSMQSVVAEFQTKKEEPSSAPSKLVTDEEIEEYGSDLIDLVGRRAKEVYEPIVSELKSEVDELKRKLGGVSKSVGETNRDRLFSQLDARVEDWDKLNESAEFLNWLDHMDPYSGEQRGRMLRAAVDANDIERVVAFFEGFKKEHAVVSPPSAKDSGSSKEESTRTPSVDLNDQVAPGRGSTKVATPTGTQDEKRIWTRPQISEFYADVQRGKFKGEEGAKRKAAIERDIQSAITEGRIR